MAAESEMKLWVDSKLSRVVKTAAPKVMETYIVLAVQMPMMA